MSQREQQGVNRRDFLKQVAAGTVVGTVGMKASQARAAESDPTKTRSYNENMEYRRLGKTDLWVSAVCLGGHWKRLNAARGHAIDLPEDDAMDDFLSNRSDIVSACIDAGINYVDACASGEILAYARVLKGRRESMYFGFSWYENELRFEDWRTKEKLIQGFENGLKESGLDYVDVWRVSALMDETQPDADVEATVEAFHKLHYDGKVRFLGMSSHNHPFLKHIIETWPEISVILFPYTASSERVPEESLFDAVKECDVGVFGIKPFSSNSLFAGNSQDDSPTRDDDDMRARLTLRHILANDAITAPIPGLISVRQVENAVKAVQERRELGSEEQAQLKEAARQMTARLPADYQWLRDWERV